MDTQTDQVNRKWEKMDLVLILTGYTGRSVDFALRSGRELLGNHLPLFFAGYIIVGMLNIGRKLLGNNLSLFLFGR